MQVLYEIPLSVRFSGRVVELPKVRVVENTVYPLILRVDWIDLSGARVRSKEMFDSSIQPLSLQGRCLN